MKILQYQIPSVDRNRVFKAAQIAAIEKDIGTFEKGYDTCCWRTWHDTLWWAKNKGLRLHVSSLPINRF